ncbi:hypothetical protein Tco_0992397 [Tanacetum coccineum]|uniref:Uncharacterized protein n=1 Tax=Tanacetum coccineum TaxID=301880 RepID=A0ABQ5F205_9ASTR
MCTGLQLLGPGAKKPYGGNPNLYVASYYEKEVKTSRKGESITLIEVTNSLRLPEARHLIDCPHPEMKGVVGPIKEHPTTALKNLVLAYMGSPSCLSKMKDGTKPMCHVTNRELNKADGKETVSPHPSIE